jgi:hypothetical protein
VPEARPDLSRARCSVDFDWVSHDVRDLVLNENLQNKRSDFVLKSIAQNFNSRALDDVLKLAADASVGAVNCFWIRAAIASVRWTYESSRSITIAFAAFSAFSTAACMSPAGPRGPAILLTAAFVSVFPPKISVPV